MGNFINPLGYWNVPEPVFKIYVEMRERVDSMSRLGMVFINRVLEDWGQIYTDFFASRLTFLRRWGGGEGGVLSAFS